MPKIVAFACEHSAYEAAAAAAALGQKTGETMPMEATVPGENPGFQVGRVGGVEIVKVPCTGRVEVIDILKALEGGADGVIVLGCFEEACHYLTGNVRAKKRVGYVRRLIRDIGIEEDRIQFFHLAPDMDARFSRIIEEFSRQVENMGPGPATGITVTGIGTGAREQGLATGEQAQAARAR
ncbi:MAG: hydrogenase iron-sulfur subunit [Firmicutes bacterium]|nr:hydrogenase iron-sulfur subunit [Bacillota bacterium]